MSIIQGMLAEFTYESATTRKMLERIPEAKLGWKPHNKSMTLARLASHIAETPEWLGSILQQDEFVFDPTGYTPKEHKTVAELLAAFDKNVESAAAMMQGQSDDHLMKMWRMRSPERVFFEMPRVAVIRTMIMNHTVHHRGQLSVYLRLLDVPLPSVYGPTADDPGV